MARKPKGSIIQPLPSWNLRRMYGTGYGNGPVPLGNIVGSGVFNASTRGEWLVIWDVQVNASGTFTSGLAIIDFSIMHGTAQYGGFQFQPANPLTSQTPATPSQGWGFNDSANEQGLVFGSYFLPVTGYQWVHDWPFCAIAPGDSVVVYSDANQYHSFGAAWTFEVVPAGI
jgi:hypothetical protein